MGRCQPVNIIKSARKAHRSYLRAIRHVGAVVAIAQFISMFALVFYTRSNSFFTINIRSNYKFANFDKHKDDQVYPIHLGTYSAALRCSSNPIFGPKYERRQFHFDTVN